jgi:release factor glutamine methyltransferase
VGSRSVVADRLRAAGCVFAEDEARLLVSNARTPAELAEMVERRAHGEPLEYILGWARFCGLRIAVDPGVFIPRRRTELLAREAVGLVRPGAVVVDLCCGSGAVGAAIAAAADRIELHAVDLDPSAVQCARKNLAGVGQVYDGDLYSALPASLRGRVDVLVANAPYVPTSEIALLPAEARTFEPRMTLDGGADGLEVVRRVISSATGWLTRGGTVLVEASERQAPRVVDLMAGHGLVPRVVAASDLDATVVIGILARTRRNVSGSA